MIKKAEAMRFKTIQYIIILGLNQQNHVFRSVTNPSSNCLRKKMTLVMVSDVDLALNGASTWFLIS